MKNYQYATNDKNTDVQISKAKKHTPKYSNLPIGVKFQKHWRCKHIHMCLETVYENFHIYIYVYNLMIEYSSSQIYQQMRSILSQWTIKTSHSKTFWDSNLSAVIS